MKNILIIGLLFFSVQVSGQEMLGIVNSNFAGSNGIYINPSSIANDKLLYDINILTVGTFFQNNYFYLPQQQQASFIKVLSGAYTFTNVPKPYGEGERNVQSYYNDKSVKAINSNTRIVGPSAMFRVDDHSFVVHTGVRAVSSTTNLPYDIANFAYYTMDFSPQHNINYKRDNVDMASLAWWELGITYATVLKRKYSGHWSAGITVNKLFGYAAAYYTGDYMDYIVYYDTIINVKELDAELGMSLPMDYDNGEIDPYEDLNRGGGWSMDLGFTYQSRPNKGYRRKLKNGAYNKRFEDYDFKIGVAILDLGYINMKQNAQLHNYDHVSNNWINVNDFEYTTPNDELREVSEIFYGDPDASLQADQFVVYLPTALSLQFDYHYKNSWYLNATMVMPVKFTDPQLKRPTVMAVIPRYESRIFEVNIPFSLYNYKYVRLGLSVRVWDFTIGTEKLGGFFSRRDFTGYDVYFSYKINITESKRSGRSATLPYRANSKAYCGYHD